MTPSSLAPAARAPAELTPDRLAEVLAILVIDMAETFGIGDRRAALERLANRLDGQGRTIGGSAAADTLGAIGGALMRLGC